MRGLLGNDLRSAFQHCSHEKEMPKIHLASTTNRLTNPLKKNTNTIKLKSSVASCDIPEHAWESNWNKVSVESLYVTLTGYRLQILFSGNHAPGKISYQVRKDTTLQTPSNLGHSDFWLNPVQRRQTAQNVNSKQTNTVN